MAKHVVINSDHVPKLSAAAATLKANLRHGGGNVAMPSVYPGLGAFNDHAIAYLTNAVATCRDTGLDDFRQYGGLYQVRHGIELWLKSVIQNGLMDRALRQITRGDKYTLDDVVKEAEQDDKRAEGKAHLQRALCVYRNVDEDKLAAPDAWHRNMDRGSAERAIAYMRENGKQPRSHFETLWCPLVKGHNLMSLFDRAKDYIADMHQHANYVVTVIGMDEPMDTSDIAAACELITAWDPSGDAFRYPTSPTGQWYLQLPPISLDALGDLAQELEDTVRCYDALADEAYNHATLRSPFPDYYSLL